MTASTHGRVDELSSPRADILDHAGELLRALAARTVDGTCPRIERNRVITSGDAVTRRRPIKSVN